MREGKFEDYTEEMMRKVTAADKTAYFNFIQVKAVRDKRMRYDEKKHFTDPNTIYTQFKGIFQNCLQEKFVVLHLDNQLMPVGAQVAGIGCSNKCIVDTTAVIRGAILSGASSVIFMHNHPSMCGCPSSEDKDITERLVTGMRIVGIRALDHIIFTDEGYHSMRESGDAKFED